MRDSKKSNPHNNNTLQKVSITKARYKRSSLSAWMLLHPICIPTILVLIYSNSWKNGVKSVKCQLIDHGIDRQFEVKLKHVALNSCLLRTPSVTAEMDLT